jgi:hypothetical protein
MGFSALDGLMMGTRTGSLDPGALLYLMEVESSRWKKWAARCTASPACSVFPGFRPNRA